MSQIVTQNPGSSEIQSPLIAGITEGLNKLSAVLNLKTGTLEDVQLTAVSIDNEEKNKNRIYEANFGNRLWLSFPAPVIKKNGSEITQSGSNFTIDYIGGSITFSAESKPSDGDKITVSATYIIAESDALEEINTALSAVQTQSSKYKGNYDNVGALQLAHSSAQNGDYAIVFDPLAVYAWKNDGWYDTRSIEDLSDYYNKGETNNLLGQKEPTIQQKGTSASDDDYYWGGRKTWQDFKEKVRSTVLTGLSTASDAAVSATDTLLVAVGKLQAQVSNATQRAYLTGTGAPSTSTVGAVGQRYVNTSNGDEYTCEEVSGDTYTWRLHTRSVNGKRPETPGGNIQLDASDIGAANEEDGVSVYTHSRSGNVNEFTGTGPNGRAKMTADVQAGDTFTVNGAPATAYMGAESAAAAMAGSAWNGRWVSFVVDGATLNFKGGGGLSAADGAKLIPGNIKAGVTLFAGTPKQVVGTFTNDANAAASSIKQGVVAYSKGQRLVGALPPYGPQTITPTTRDQSFGPGVYLAGQINVKGDPNLVAGNIRQGVSIFGVTGALPVRAKPAILHAQSWASNSNFTELYSSDSFVKSQNNVWTCTKACRAQVVCIALSSGGHSTTSATAKGVVTTATVGDGGDYYSIVTNTQASQIFDFYPGDAVQVAHNCGYHTNTGIIVICPV